MSVTWFSPDNPEKLAGINQLLKLSLSCILQTAGWLFIPGVVFCFPPPLEKPSPLWAVSMDPGAKLCLWCAAPAAQGQPPAEGQHPKSSWQGLWGSLNRALILLK